MKVAVVMTDPLMAESLADTVRACGHKVYLSPSLPDALRAEPALVFCEWREGPPMLTLRQGLHSASARSNPIPVVALVASGGLLAMRRARALGAAEVLFSPPEPEEVRAELEAFGNPTVADTLDRGAYQRLLEESLVGECAVFRKCLDELKQAVRCEANVLLMGETGTGKEMFARAIHALGRRSAEPYVAVNCASLSGTVLESELFGHAKGAFTGAQTERPGRFEAVGAGTLLLDEVGDIEPALQMKLLRVIEQKEFQRVGENKSQKFNGRLVCATSVKLEQAVESGKFRRDLLGRIDQFRITLPPLRERRADIPILIRHFLRKHGQARRVDLSRTVADLLESFEFPMNVRQLENVVVGALARSVPGMMILPQHLPKELMSPAPTSAEAAGPAIRLPQTMSYKDARAFVCREVDRMYLLPLLDKHKGNQSRIAEEAGVDRGTIGVRVKELADASNEAPTFSTSQVREPDL